ncbi:hypothetical protein AB0B21_38605 [Streptomyces rimosus]|uniref:hypothetical protein n=1 Tax=Streptomyces rimosus TaxID=1927 RepID=UPI00131E8E32|nr:hypothetical protein [Streptomyces rimosus]
MVVLGLGNPLLLTESSQERLLGAVRALVDDPALAGASYGARLGAVVLVAKACARRGHRVVIQTRELGRWLGQSREQVARTVLPELRQAGVLDDRQVVDASGNAALDCAVVPLVRAREAGERRHPLALSRSELAVLLALCEVLFAPGWGGKGRGLLAGRCGKGAAMDRLGLLLVVLSAAPSGWLRLCPGTVTGGRGRPAATVALLLGCSADAAARLLGRLEGAGLVQTSRRETVARMCGRGRVCVVPVAKARGRRMGPGRPAGGGSAGIRDCADRSQGGLGPAGSDAAPGVTGVSEPAEVPEAAFRDCADTSHLHAVHASGVVEEGDGAGACGFSGEGRPGSGDQPECTDACEDLPMEADVFRPRRVSAAGWVSAHRAEQPTPSSRPALFSCLGPVLSRRVPQVAGLLTGIVPSPNGYQRERLARVVRGLLASGEDDAMIAARLRERLKPLVTGDADRPYAFRRDGLSWALTVGLPYTPGGLTMLPCSRRGCRGTVRARPTDTVRCDDCELAVRERKHAAAARQAAAAPPRPETPCSRCGESASAGLCGVCWADEETEALVMQAVAFVAAGCGDPDAPEMTTVLAGMAEKEACSRIQDACAHLASAGGTDGVVALQARLTAQSLVDEYRATALLTLGTSSPQAEAEARSAYAAQLRRRHLHPSAEAARQAAEEAGEEARRRTAGYLLTQRSRAWLAARSSAAVAPAPAARSAAYEAGAARARAAGTHRPVRDGRTGQSTDAGHLLARPEVNALRAAADAEETARLRAQIAAELPGLAAVTTAHHGTVYDMPPRPSAGQVVPGGCHDEESALKGMPV